MNRFSHEFKASNERLQSTGGSHSLFTPSSVLSPQSSLFISPHSSLLTAVPPHASLLTPHSYAPYAEIHCLSNFTFLRGASHPEELVARAAGLGYAALAITDECSMAGVVRAHLAAKQHGIQLIIGSEVQIEDGPCLVLLATDREGYGRLSDLITRGRRAAPKGSYRLARADLADGLPGCLVLWCPADKPDAETAQWLTKAFSDRAWLAVELLCGPDDRARREALENFAYQAKLPAVAAGDVHMHIAGRRALQDTVTAIRLGCPLSEAGLRLYPNGERHLRSRERLARLYPPPLLAETVTVAARCRFSLDELRYEYPQELVPAGDTPATRLRKLTDEGIQHRWPAGPPEKVLRQVQHELALIRELRYEPYFLTVHDIVKFARSRGILCQGRGSAANSAVCYCLGITEVDPARMEMLFERFVSRERHEPPDIDVDFEHERREEVIQYIYRRYGRDRAALAATVITYQARSAVRDVGKALGLEPSQVDRLAGNLYWWDGRQVAAERLREIGFEADSPLIARLLDLVNTLIGFPRHLSQHVGGFVISRGPLSRLVPIENAAMPERTVIQWDKDDLDALGLLKVDVLGLGMLSAVRRALDLVNDYRGSRLTLSDIPPEDPDVYQMIQSADTVGVFQIESRAQMAMLPRLKPRCFYDLVIEVAIVRPGPIQGHMVHPYLRRRQGIDPVTYPSSEVREVLERTLGVPIFQEQVIKLAMVAAGFSAGEADRLRRAMAAWRRRGGLEPFEKRLIEGMRARGYAESFARQIFQQILGFGEYGFPESHAGSFALLVYVSAWLKRHEPAAFTCALINSQPMGFYAPSQLVQDVRRHGVEARPVDVAASRWDCTLEPAAGTQPALRLGLRLVKGLARRAAERIVAARKECSFQDVQDLARRARLNRRDLEALGAGDALASLAGNRHHASWQALGVEPALPLGDAPLQESRVLLPIPTEGQDIVSDYAHLGLTLRRHPLALLRQYLDGKGISSATRVHRLPHRHFATACGLVITRQRPASAAGVTFLTLEDETGVVNVVVWEAVAERQRAALIGARLMKVDGIVEREGEVVHLVASTLEDQSRLLGQLLVPCRSFQ